MTDIILFAKDSPEDLILRGFTRKYILSKLGVDVGVHDSTIRKHISNINNKDYIITFIKSNFSDEDITYIIDNHKSKQEVLDFFGINGKLSIKDIFERIGFTNEYIKARNKRTHEILMTATRVKYGVEHAMQSDTVKQKSKETCLKKYGVEHPMQNIEIQKAASQTCMNRYGVSNPKQYAKFKHKAERSCFSHFGVKYPMQSKDVIEKSKETCLKKYGAVHPMQSDMIRKKVIQTCVDKYGVRNVFQSKEVKSKIKKTMISRYGVGNPKQSDLIKQKARQTCFNNYGVEYPMQSRQIIEKSGNTLKTKYGVSNIMQLRDTIDKVIKTKHENNTFNVSSSEAALYKLLLDVFGEDDIHAQYNQDPRYPFCCDFYIASRDMFIELNAFWSHGHHWFNPALESDKDTLQIWKDKNTEFYNNVIHTWSVSDVQKRNTAMKNNLDYVVFWSDKLEDASLWFALGCPDGKDWEHEYSWIPSK